MRRADPLESPRFAPPTLICPAPTRLPWNGLLERARRGRVLDHAERAVLPALGSVATDQDPGWRPHELAHQALDLANLAYHAGATTNIEVIDAELRARDADSAVVIAEDNVRQARLDLLVAAGQFP